jgi:Lhr-like helicase
MDYEVCYIAYLNVNMAVRAKWTFQETFSLLVRHYPSLYLQTSVVMNIVAYLNNFYWTLHAMLWQNYNDLIMAVCSMLRDSSKTSSTYIYFILEGTNTKTASSSFKRSR